MSRFAVFFGATSEWTRNQTLQKRVRRVARLRVDEAVAGHQLDGQVVLVRNGGRRAVRDICGAEVLVGDRSSPRLDEREDLRTGPRVDDRQEGAAGVGDGETLDGGDEAGRLGRVDQRKAESVELLEVCEGWG